MRWAVLFTVGALGFASSAFAALEPGLIYYDSFDDGKRVDRDDPAHANWYASHSSVTATEGRLDTQFNTEYHLIAGQVSGAPLSLSRETPLQLTLDYNPRTDDNIRTRYVLVGLYAGDAATADGFTIFNREPGTNATSDWSGYHVRLGMDGTTSLSYGIFRSTPADDLGSVHFHNNVRLADVDAELAPVRAWDPEVGVMPMIALRLLLYLDADDNAVIEYWAGEDRESLALVATAVDDDPSRIIEGLQNIGLGARGSQLNDGAPNARVLFDNITLEYVPEPASLALLGVGALALLRRHRAEARH